MAQKRQWLPATGATLAALGALIIATRRWSRWRNNLIDREYPVAAVDPDRIRALTDAIVDEAVRAFGLPLTSWQARALRPVLRPPSASFARLAIGFDHAVANQGIDRAFDRLLPYCVRALQVRGADTIPPTGPVLLLSNHPGGYDLPLLLSNLPRQDVRMVFSTVPLTTHLPAFRSHLIEVTLEPQDGMRALRQSIRQLRSGGVLQIFPTGIVDPDPDLLPGAQEALANWKPGIDLMLRTVPQTQVVIAIISGVLSPGWLRSPLVRVLPDDAASWRQRKLAEFLQIMQQLLFPGHLRLPARISFAPPVTAGELLDGADQAELHGRLVERARALLVEHMAAAR